MAGAAGSLCPARRRPAPFAGRLMSPCPPTASRTRRARPDLAELVHRLFRHTGVANAPPTDVSCCAGSMSPAGRGRPDPDCFGMSAGSSRSRRSSTGATRAALTFLLCRALPPNSAQRLLPDSDRGRDPCRADCGRRDLRGVRGSIPTCWPVRVFAPVAGAPLAAGVFGTQDRAEDA